jgi:hypothetical protein
LSVCAQVLARETPLSVKICGVLVQGSKRLSGLYLVLHSAAVRKDGNAAATELFSIIAKPREQHHRHLILSFDNAAGEAKNDTVLALCALLVWLDWFETVEIHLLEPGHTHTYLDALFSHVQRALSERTLASVADVIDALSHAFTTEHLQPHILFLQCAFDWVTYFDKYLHTVAGHSKPLGFRFVRVGSGPEAAVRMWMRDNSKGEWLGYRRTSEPIVVLRSLPRGDLKAVPLVAASTSDRTAWEETIKQAANHNLIEQSEAKELRRIIAQGTLGAKPLSVPADDFGVGRPAEVQRPERKDQRQTDSKDKERKNKFVVRLIDQVPTSVQPPPASRQSVAAAAAPKPPVPLFYKPRVAVITDKPSELKRLREAAERDVAARESGMVGAGSGNPVASPAASASAATSAERKSPAPVRSSPRNVPGKPARSSNYVPWALVDDDDDRATSRR